MHFGLNSAAIRTSEAAVPPVAIGDLHRVYAPLDPDAEGDVLVTVSRRGLARLALVATETGARFVRDGIGHDPLAWIVAPRRLFGGRPAIEACLERTDCTRAVMLHALGLGLDADGEAVDSLLDDGEEDPVARCASGHPLFRLVGSAGRPRLFTAVVIGRGDLGHVHAFGAAVVGCADEMRDLVRRHLGSALADAADVAEGFAPGSPVADAMLSEALADTLRLVASDPSSPLAEGMEVMLQQRFAN